MIVEASPKCKMNETKNTSSTAFVGMICIMNHRLPGGGELHLPAYPTQTHNSKLARAKKSDESMSAIPGQREKCF